MKIKFGTGGFRGIMGAEFTKEAVEKIVQAICNTIEKENLKKEVFIGYDNRFMSEDYASWASEVFAGNKINVKLMKKASTTPVVMYYARTNKLDFSIMITASHNPYLYNGVKVFTQEGKDASVEQTKKLEEEIEKISPEEIKRLPRNQAIQTGLIQLVDLDDEYLNSLLNIVKVNTAPKIAFDAMFGSSINLLNKLIQKIKFEKVALIHDIRNPFFAFSMPSPLPETTTALRDLVLNEGYDLGLALDGDGDRLGVIDRNGNYIDNNYLMACVYYFMVKYKGMKGDIVKNASTSHILDALAEKFGFKCHTVPVGFKYVSQKLKETNALLGGESSGGLAILPHILGKDSLLSIVLILEILSVTQKPLDQFVEEVKEFVNFYNIYSEKQYNCTPEQKDYIYNKMIVKKLLPTFDKEILSADYTDGVKVIFKDNTWFMIRFSGTEPVIRVYCEVKTTEEKEKLNNLLDEFLEIN